MAEEFLEVLSLLMEEFRDFLREFLLVEVSLVASVFDDEGGGTSGLLTVLFLVGNCGSHLTRAAFVVRLDNVLEVPRLLVVAVVVVRIGLRAGSRWAEVSAETLAAFRGDSTASRPPPLLLLETVPPKGVDLVRT